MFRCCLGVIVHLPDMSMFLAAFDHLFVVSRRSVLVISGMLFPQAKSLLENNDS